MARRDTTALLKQLKKRLNQARKALLVEDSATALEHVDWAILELEELAEESAEVGK